MKKMYLLCCCLPFAAFAQFHDLGFGYQLGIPRKAMQNGWNNAHGIALNYYYLPPTVKGLGLGVQIGYGTYAFERNPQQYRFQDGTITNTFANLSSALYSTAASVRYIPRLGKKWSPFAELQAGYFAMNSSIYIEDPRDPLACRALESRNIVHSGTFFTAWGGGLQWVVAKEKKGDEHVVEVSARSLYGGNLTYANMNRTYDHHAHTNSNTNPAIPPKPGETPMVITFVNVTTNAQHEHTVAEIYEHPLRALQLNVQYTYRIRRK